jgi:hypothetical protein
VVPADPAVIDMLRASPLLWVDETGGALIKLEQVDRRWILTDDVHGTSDPTLFALLPGELASARALLEHYTRYALPLRMAERLIDRTGEFELDVLVCPSKELLAAQAQTIELPEAQPGHGRYALTAGARVCFRVRNTSSVALRVTLVNSAASGKVQLLGDQVVDARTSYVFWARNVLGAPFTMTPAAGKERCIDRLTAIGRTAMDVDLSHLRVDQPFEHVVRDSRGPKDIGDGPAPATKPLEKWIATQVVIDTRVQ